MQLNAYCRRPDGDEDDDLIKSVRSGVVPDLDIAYFMRLSEIIDEQVQAVSDDETRSKRDLNFTDQFGTECTDPGYYTYADPIKNKAVCEHICRVDFACGAYNHHPSLEMCELKFNCKSTVKRQGVNSGVKIRLQPPSLPPAASNTFRRRKFNECTDENLKVIPNRNREACQWECDRLPECGAYTSYSDSSSCHIKGGPCKNPTDRIWVAMSGDKVGFKPPRQPPPPLRPKPVKFTILERVSCKDANKDVKRGVTAEACKSACASDDTCKAYTYNTVREDCFLKSTCEKQLHSSPDVSGLKPGVAVIIETTTSKFPISKESSLVGGFEWRDTVRINPWENTDMFAYIETWSETPVPNPCGRIVIYPRQHLPRQLISIRHCVSRSPKEACTPWLNKNCGRGVNPGLKVGDIHWCVVTIMLHGRQITVSQHFNCISSHSSF